MERSEMDSILAGWREEINEIGVSEFKNRYGELGRKMLVALEIVKPVVRIIK